MKLGKKAMIALSFTVGACLFVTTALADLALGTGYDRLKQSVKHTSAQLEDGLSSYTLKAQVQMQMDDVVWYESTGTLKVDNEKRASESLDETKSYNDTYRYHTYQDERTYAYKSSNDENYYVMKYAEDSEKWRGFTDPFKEEITVDLERIFDALVGNLKDVVIVEQRSEGGQQYRGDLSEVQVPALVNAVLSFAVKQSMIDGGRYDGEIDVPRLSQDIYVKKVSGRALADESGLLESAQGALVISGADENGERHEFTFRIDIQLTEIGSTVVVKPDLTDAVVEEAGRKHDFSNKYIGTYRNQIVIEQDDQFIKIGERILEITGVDSEKVTGRYVETFDPEYADLYPFEPLSIEFETEQFRWSTVFSYTNSEGETLYAELSPSRTGNVNLNMHMKIDPENEYFYYEGDYHEYFFSEFHRIFE